MLYPIGKQAYKLEQSARWKIYNVFYVSLLEQDTTKKEQKFSVPESEPGNNKECKKKASRHSVVYNKKADGHLSELYYLVI